MSYKVDLKNEPGYIHATASGVRSLENILFVIRDCLRGNEKHGYEKMLLDVGGMIGKLSTFEVYDLGKEAEGRFKQLNPAGQTAIVDLEENRERFRFVESVLINRGFNVRFFTDVDEAKQWLLEGK